MGRIFTSFFMSLMFPTIFALGIKELDQHKLGGSMIIMAIVGGAAFLNYGTDIRSDGSMALAS